MVVVIKETDVMTLSTGAIVVVMVVGVVGVVEAVGVVVVVGEVE